MFKGPTVFPHPRRPGYFLGAKLVLKMILASAFGGLGGVEDGADRGVAIIFKPKTAEGRPE
jgi:hypothetical protein